MPTSASYVIGYEAADQYSTNDLPPPQAMHRPNRRRGLAVRHLSQSFVDDAVQGPGGRRDQDGRAARTHEGPSSRRSSPTTRCRRCARRVRPAPATAQTRVLFPQPIPHRFATTRVRPAPEGERGTAAAPSAQVMRRRSRRSGISARQPPRARPTAGRCGAWTARPRSRAGARARDVRITSPIPALWCPQDPRTPRPREALDGTTAAAAARHR